VVSSIAYDKDQARITLRSVRDTPGIAASIFIPLAEANIPVDMIVQNPSRDGVTDMNFTVTHKDLKRALAIMDEVCKKVGGIEMSSDADVAKITAIGVGMRNHSGVAAKLFAAFQKENINIIMISTSEIKISCIIPEKYTELAVRILHDAFGLDKGSYLEG
jgi:aspartate kinase